jgi:hypothetical protein
VVPRPDGLGVAAFGATRQEALSGLRRKLGPTDETGSWSGATPFGTCPGDTRAVRWGRLYVLFTNGPTRYAPTGTWHLFAYRVDAVQRTKVEPQYSGPTPPPDPPRLRGYSPRPRPASASARPSPSCVPPTVAVWAPRPASPAPPTASASAWVPAASCPAP